MPRSRAHTPKLCLHKSTGQAFVLVAGKPKYLGKYNSPEAQQRYAQFINDLAADRKQSEAAARSPVSQTRAPVDITIAEVLADFHLRYAIPRYQKHGEQTRTIDNLRMAWTPLDKHFGEMRARDFDSLLLMELRDRMIAERRVCRRTINERVRVIQAIFRWAASFKLVPIETYQQLATVDGIRKGHAGTFEGKGVGVVPDAVVDRTLPHLPAVVADMVRLQRLTGARPGEVCMLRPIDVQRYSDDPTPQPLAVWTYRPASHKTEHHGKERIIQIGPKAQQILAPYLLRAEDAFCFSPAESEAQQREARTARRKTPANCGNQAVGGPAKRRALGNRYDKDSYGRAVKRACIVAFDMPAELRSIDPDLPAAELAKRKKEAAAWRKKHCWSPNQLRHTAATAIRKQFGLEGTQVVLGHSRADVTQVYADRDQSLAARIMQEVG